MAAPTLPFLAPLTWAIDQVAARVTGRPASIRRDGAPLDLLRGRARLLTIGVEDLRVAGLTINKGIVRIENARINPSLEPRLTGGPLTAKLTVEQERVDEWIGRASLPFRLELTDEGIVYSAGVGPLRMGKVLTEVAVREDGALRLRPIKAVGRTLPAGLMTSNLGSPMIMLMAGQDGELIREAVLTEVKGHLRPEFLNRIDETVVFHALGREHIEAIAKIQLKVLAARLDKLEMKLDVSPAGLAELAKVGFDPVFGARPLKRAIQARIENPVARLILQGRFGPKDVIPVDVEDGEFTFGRVVH